MKEIESLQNPIVKSVVALQQKKERDKTGLFFFEGQKPLKEALNFGVEIKHIFLDKKHSGLAENLPYEKIILADEKVLKKISSTESPPPVITVAKQLNYKLEDVFSSGNPFILLIEDIKDPGNLGTIIRTARATNVSGIILTGKSVDIYNPKVIRSAAGNLWKIPVIESQFSEKLISFIKNYNDFNILATAVKDGFQVINFNEIDYKKPALIMFGSEAEGLSDSLINRADKIIKIPMHKGVESLNLSVSVGIITYEVFRQRSFG